MNRRLLTPLTAALVATATALVGAGPASAAGAHGTGAPPGPDALASSSQTFTGSKVGAELSKASGQVTAFVKLTTTPAVDVANAGGSKAQVDQAVATTQKVADQVVPTELTTANAKTAEPKRVATTVNVAAGALVTGDAQQIRALAADPKVAGIYAVTPKTIDNSSADAFTKALATWQSTGYTGAGVKVGIIDTGLDYTHADFGGPGTAAAYAQAYGKDGTGPIPAGTFDPKKFAGGHDFAGPTYDGAVAGSVPTEDDNPIDAPYTGGNDGHGSHVAGTAAGYGVQADGTTFTGDYGSLTDLSGWKVGPGTAPGATLYALKVFGDAGGSTNLVLPALDWAADPNGDGDLSDHLDVVNLSLGSDFSPGDDPENIAIDGLSKLGVSVVTAAGNGGDLEDVAGSPGNAASTISVANSVASPVPFAGIQVTGSTDPALLKSWAGQNSVAYPSGQPDVTAPVVYLGAKVDGCTPFTAAQKQAVAGKIVWLWWNTDDSSRACGSAGRSNNAAAAGAVGALLTNDTTVFSGGITGSATIPVAQMTTPTTQALEAQAAAGTLAVHIGPSLAGTVLDTSTPDVVNPSSSRGDHGSLGWSKPDVAAPGTNIVSVASSTGTGSETLTGTSMASPHVAGIAALVRSAHPGWTPAEVKSAIVNTATHDLYTGPNRTGAVYGPARVGSGRVDALAAVQDTILAYSSDNPEQTAVSFGVVPVGATKVTVKKTVTVQNVGTTARTFRTSFTTSTTAGAASITVSPSSVTVPAGQRKVLTLTLTADPATLARDIDPTQAVTQAGTAREYVTRLTGRVVLTSGGTELRVPVQAVPKPTSELASAGLAFADPVAATAPLQVSGRALTTGGWTSFATPLVLAATSPRLNAVDPKTTSPSAIASGDLRYVGWGSTGPAAAAAGGDPTSGTLNVGIAVDGNWASLGTAVQPVVDTDVNGDGTPDYQTYAGKVTGADLTVAWTIDLSTGRTVGAYYVNEFTGVVDNGVYDNSVAVLPIPLSIIPKGAKPSLSVWTSSIYAPDPTTGVIDQVAPFTVDPYDPPLWFDSNVGDRQTSLVTGPTTITAHKGTGAASAKVLVLYPQNATPAARAQVVDVAVPAPTATTTTLTVTGGTVSGHKATLTATVAPAAATGTVAFLDGTKTIATAPVTAGKATVAVNLGAGKHQLTAVFTPATGFYAGSTSPVVTYTVARSSTTTSLSVAPTTVRYGTQVTATVKVTSSSAVPAGATVQVLEAGKVLGSGTVTATGLSGSATVALPRTLAAGEHTLTARLVPTSELTGSTSRPAVVTVSRAPAALAVTTSSWSVARGATPTLTITASGPKGAPAPGGNVVVLVNFHTVATVGLTNGSATVTIPPQYRSGIVAVGYAGDGGYGPAVAGGFLQVH